MHELPHCRKFIWIITTFLLVIGGMAGCTETKVVEKVVENQEAIPTLPPTNAGLPSDKPPETILTKDITPPLVASLNPGDNFQGVAAGSEVSAIFNEAIAPESITTNTFQITDSNGDIVAGAVSYDPSSQVAIFKPEKELLDGEYYTVILTNGIKDVAGNAMQLPHTSLFQVSHSDTEDTAAGQNHFLAVKANGSVWAWGRNQWGQLGDGTRIDRNRPVRVNGLENIVIRKVSAGNSFSLALDKDGNVWAWGRNQYGQLGSDFPDWSSTPIQVNTLNGIESIASGRAFSLALDKNNNVWAWGQNNYGQLGDGTTTNHSTPAMITALSHAIAIDAGGIFGLAQTQSDPQDPQTRQLWAWGLNSSGQLGVGDTENRSSPVAVLSPAGTDGNLINVQSFAAGYAHTLVVTDDGKLLAWGSNTRRQLGYGTAAYRSRSVIVKDPEESNEAKFASVGAGSSSYTSYAIDTNGSIWGWGDNRHRQLMQINPNMAQISPTQIGTIKSPLKIMGANIPTANGGVTMILRSDKSIAMAGFNLNGQLGNGSASFYSYKPNYLPNVPPATDISGRSFINQAGDMWAWGRAADCEVGTTASDPEIMVPNKISISDVKQISHGQYHILALKKDGTVWAWGRKSHGEAGTGTDPCVPTQILGPDNKPIQADEVGAGWDVSLALLKKTESTPSIVYAWGSNADGNLGLGTTDKLPHPNATIVPFPEGVTNIKSIYTYIHAAAITDDGKIYLWGQNTGGQLGDGTKTSPQTSPTLNPTITNADKVVMGDYHTLVLLMDGTVMAMGSNGFGQLGYHTELNTSSPNPTLISGLNNITSLAACGSVSAAVMADTTMYTWGDNKFGQLGQGTGNSIEYATPTQIQDPNGNGPFKNVAQASCQGNIFVIRLMDDTIWEWGFSGTQTLFFVKDGESTISAFPVTVNWP